MGLNDYNSFDKKKADTHSNRLNSAHATEAEKWLRKEVLKLPQIMTPMSGEEAKDQSVERMQVEIGQAHALMDLTKQLCKQHPDTPGRAIDFGTFSGHSAGAMARGMKHGGHVITFDIKKWMDATNSFCLAEEYWKREGVADRMDFRVNPLDTGGSRKVIDELVADSKNHNTFDIAFIDAEKPGYEYYYEQALKLVRPGGKIVLDNMLWSGRVADPKNFPKQRIIGEKDVNLATLRVLGKKIMFRDERVEAFFDNGNDGQLIAEKLTTEEIEANRARGTHQAHAAKRKPVGPVLS